MTTTTETPAEALARIQSRVSQNDFAAIHQFYACGIHPDHISPRLNVLTFKAWKALGRRVAKGATGQKVCVWVPVEKEGKPDGVRPINAVLFHECQTVAEDAEKGTRPAAWNNPALVKAGTYEAIETDEHAQELADISYAEYKADEETAPTVTPTTEPAPEQADSFEPEIITISNEAPAQQTDKAAEAKAFNRFAKLMEPVWASAQETTTPKARKQLSMF